MRLLVLAILATILVGITIGTTMTDAGGGHVETGAFPNDPGLPHATANTPNYSVDTLTYVNLSPSTPAGDQMAVRVGTGGSGDTILQLANNTTDSDNLVADYLSTHPDAKVVGWLHPSGHFGAHLPPGTR